MIKETVAALRAEIVSSFVAAIESVKEGNVLSLSDMYVMVLADEAKIAIYDDLENLLVTCPLASYEAWHEENPMNSGAALEMLLTEVVEEEQMKARLEELNISTPFSVIWVNEEMEQLAELLTIDYDNMLLNEDFFDKIDKELDTFFDRIMKDVI